MRLRKLNRLVMVAVSSTLAGMTASISGCKHQPPPTTAHPTHSGPQPVQMKHTTAAPTPTVTPPMPAPLPLPTSLPTTLPATEPTTMPATQATATTAPTADVPAQPAAVVPPPVPATAPTTAPDVTPVPAPLPVPAATTVPTTVPVTQPAVATGPDHNNETVPATAPTTAPAVTPVVTPSVAPATAPATPAATMPSTAPVAALPPTKDVPPSTDPDEVEGDAALAERLASIAELSFPAKVTSNDAWPFLWRQQAALYSAATSLNPAEARYARLTADADAQAHDLDGETHALLTAYRAKPDDEVSWNKRLDIVLSQIQNGQLQLKYLRGVMDSKMVPANVRAHAGFRSAQIMGARGQDAGASTVLEEALRYNPSSVECLTLRYAMLPANAPRFERVGRLLDLLKANPLQWQYSAQVAELIAGGGLIKQSIPWYNLAVSTAHQMHQPASATVLDMAAALYITDRKLDASNVITALLEYDPKFYSAWFMQLVVARAGSDKDAFAKTLQTASNALSNRVVEVVDQVAKTVTNQPTTRPISSEGPYPLPDFAPVVAKLKADGTPEQKQLFVEAVADLARLDIYFAQKPDAAAPLITALQVLLPANDPLIAQLQGWSDVLANKPEDARAKLTTIAADDPLAQLGLIKLLMTDPDKREQAESLARKLVQENPSGLVGAMVWEGLRSQRVKLILTDQSVALQQEIAGFPQSLLTIGEKPQLAYTVHATPVPSGRYYGDPLLAQVTILNLTDNDLTVGDDGVIKPQLLFTITTKQATKNTEFQAIDTLASPTVIHAHGYCEQVVRVDQSQLLAFLSDPATTTTAFEISGIISTNETTNRLGGYPSVFTKDYYRLATPVTPDKVQSVLSSVSSGSPGQKITALTQLQLLVEKLQNIPNPNGGPNKAIPVLTDQLHRARGDTIPAVAAWATKCEFELSQGDDRVGIITDMTDDSDWRHRQLALSLLSGVDESVREPILKKLLIDPQSSVRAEAAAVQGLMSIPDSLPTTAPTTAPVATP